MSKLLSSHQSRVLYAVESLRDGRGWVKLIQGFSDMALTRIKVDIVSPDISILRSANPSGVSAIRLVYALVF